MGKAFKCILLLLLVIPVLSGCVMTTVEQLYCLPQRLEEYENVRAVIDKAMQGMTYSAPIYGDNRHVIQAADLDGDGVDEYLVFANDNSDRPLKIMIFCQLASGCVLMDTIEGYGFGFDFVAYAQMDDRPGVELIVGRQVSNQVMRSVSVYRFSSGFARQLLNTSYNELITTDMDLDGTSELFVLTSGLSENSAGNAKLFTYEDGELQRSVEIPLSAPMTEFKRLESGMLQEGLPAIYVTSASDDQRLALDIFVVADGNLQNFAKGITLPSIDNYYIYSQDVDDDGILELPRLVPLSSLEDTDPPQYMIEWYTLDSNKQEVKKSVTFHNYSQNWYLVLDSMSISSLSVRQGEAGCSFFYNGEKMVTILALTDADREEQSRLPGRVVLYGSETVIYVAILENEELEQNITQELFTRFHPIRMELNTEED